MGSNRDGRLAVSVRYWVLRRRSASPIHRSFPIVIFAFALSLTACGTKPKDFNDRVSVRRDPTETMQRTQSVNVTAAAGGAISRRQNEQVMFLVAASASAKEQPSRHREPSSDTTHQNSLPVSVAATNSSGCGGDLPPCYVMLRESGGDYAAFNPTGCGGSGCYGKWQFSGEWAGKLGLPLDLSTASPEQQDEAARQLWRGGAGCSNWDAC